MVLIFEIVLGLFVLYLAANLAHFIIHKGKLEGSIFGLSKRMLKDTQKEPNGSTSQTKEQ